MDRTDKTDQMDAPVPPILAVGLRAQLAVQGCSGWDKNFAKKKKKKQENSRNLVVECKGQRARPVGSVLGEL